MFKLAQSPEFWGTVDVQMPREGGGTVIHKVDLRFKRLTPEQLADVSNAAAIAKDDRLMVREIVVGWRGVVGEENEEVPFNDETLGQLLDVIYPGPVLAAYYALLPKARAKN